jgi:hypothetical protein
MKRISGVLVFAIAMTGGCGNEERPASHGWVERDTIRIKLDATRDRIWLLDLDGVRVYDAGRKRVIRRISLPDWMVAGFVCMPDMALDGGGSAYVSSNIQPKLWKIDAESFRVSELPIRLQGREQWDTGFGALAFAADGTLLAMTSTGGWLWTVDVIDGRANAIDSNAPFRTACDLTPELMKDLERRKPWTRS